MTTIPLHIKPSDQSDTAKAARAQLAADMAALNPQGFRQPSKKGGTSLAEKRACQAGWIDSLKPERSGRSLKKEQTRKLFRVTFNAPRNQSMQSQAFRRKRH